MYRDKENRGRVHVTFFPPDCGFYGSRHVIRGAKIFAMRIGEKEKKKKKEGKVAKWRAYVREDTMTRGNVNHAMATTTTTYSRIPNPTHSRQK